MVHPHPEWNMEDEDADDEQEPMDEEEDDKFNMYLDLVPPEEEDGPHDSNMGEITSESDMED